MQKRGSLLALYKPLLSRPWQQFPRSFAEIARHEHERSGDEQPQRGKAGEQTHLRICAERKLNLHPRAFGKVRAEGEKLLGSLVGVGHYAFTYAGGEGMAYCRANKRTAMISALSITAANALALLQPSRRIVPMLCFCDCA